MGAYRLCSSVAVYCINLTGKLSDHAPQYRVDITRVGLFGASAGGNIAAACALKSLEVATARDWVLRLVSLVVPVTAHPKAEAIFDKQRETEQSQNEKVFASAPPLPEIVTLELTKLFGKCKAISATMILSINRSV